MNNSIIIQKPEGSPRQLFLLHHGVGGSAQDMGTLGERLGVEFPEAFIVCVQAAFPSDSTSGAQWYSAQGLTDQNRPQRVAQAMPFFIGSISHWQNESGVTTPATALIGFSQGAIMALESTQTKQLLAARIISLSGCFAQLPTFKPERTTFHFIHGKEDSIIDYKQCLVAAERLMTLNADVTADVIPSLGHKVNTEVIERLIERLKTHVPKHYWEDAVKAAKTD
ncbi:MAG: esterase [Pseudomonadota bacterium]